MPSSFLKRWTRKYSPFGPLQKWPNLHYPFLDDERPATMTVEELVAKLQGLPPHLIVMAVDGDNGPYEIGQVIVRSPEDRMVEPYVLLN